jgi:hypothetical protein
LNIDEVFGEYAGDVPPGHAILTIFPDQKWHYKLTGEREFSRNGIWMHEPGLTTDETVVVLSLRPFEDGFQRYPGGPQVPQGPSITLFSFERVRLITGIVIRTCFREDTMCLTKVKK